MPISPGSWKEVHADEDKHVPGPKLSRKTMSEMYAGRRQGQKIMFASTMSRAEHVKFCGWVDSWIEATGGRKRWNV